MGRVKLTIGVKETNNGGRRTLIMGEGKPSKVRGLLSMEVEGKCKVFNGHDLSNREPKYCHSRGVNYQLLAVMLLK